MRARCEVTMGGTLQPLSLACGSADLVFRSFPRLPSAVSVQSASYTVAPQQDHAHGHGL